MTPAEAEATEAVRRFEGMTLEALRAEWRRRYGAPPGLRSVDLLRRMLAWQVQAQALGGLEAKLVREIKAAAKRAGPRRQIVDVGARLAREWQGQLHEVNVMQAGYLHRGQTYKSLSAVARVITGARWNGPRFFGLRDAGEGE